MSKIYTERKVKADGSIQTDADIEIEKLGLILKNAETALDHVDTALNQVSATLKSAATAREEIASGIMQVQKALKTIKTAKGGK